MKVKKKWLEFEICEIELSPHYKIVFMIYEYGCRWWIKFSRHHRSHPKTGKWNKEDLMEISMPIEKISQLKEAVKLLEEKIPNLPAATFGGGWKVKNVN